MQIQMIGVKEKVKWKDDQGNETKTEPLTKEEEQEIVVWICFHFLESVLSKAEFMKRARIEVRRAMEVNNSKSNEEKGGLFEWASPCDIAYVILLVQNYYEKWKKVAQHELETGTTMTKEMKLNFKNYGVAENKSGLSGNKGQETHTKLKMHIYYNIMKDDTERKALEKAFREHCEKHFDISDGDNDQEKTTSPSETVKKDDKVEQMHDDLFTNWVTPTAV